MSAAPSEGRRLDAGARASAGMHVQRDSHAVEVLLSVSQMIAGTLERDVVLRSAMDAAAQAMNAEACSILLRDEESGDLCFHLVRGEHSSGLRAIHVPIDDASIAGWVAKHDEALLLVDAYGDARFDPRYDSKTGFRTKSVICVPLNAKGKRLGVIQILNRRDGQAFDQLDLELAEVVAYQIALAIHNAEEHQARVNAERVAVVGQTIAGMAHCIKNILNGLRAGSYIIDRNLEGGELDGVTHGWGIVKRNMELLSNIVLDMLSYSKQRKPLCQPCRVNDLCRDVMDLLGGQAGEKHVTLTANLDANLASVPLDESGIRRCLINLVGNAIDACEPDKGRVVIETRLSDAAGEFTVSVRDNGCGIKDQVIDRIFDPFYSTKGAKGTGLGLAVTRKIVEEHGGVITVRSTPGAGTEFTVRLPVRRDDAAG